MPGHLQIHVEASTPNFPTVRLLVDGVDVLDPRGIEDGNDAETLLGSGALRPVDPPRRIAFYGCGCGVFDCINVTGLIARQGDVVVWSDFRSLTGEYGSGPLPDAETGPDPWASATEEDIEEFWFDSALDLPTVTFDAQQYDAAVSAATADWWWETRARRVVREIRSLRPGWSIWAAARGDVIDVDTHAGRMAYGSVTIPPGDPVELAHALVGLLDDGAHPANIDRRALWH